jgi:hypothetical protein
LKNSSREQYNKHKELEKQLKHLYLIHPNHFLIDFNGKEVQVEFKIKEVLK